jgi:putative ABC transport system permease protein
VTTERFFLDIWLMDVLCQDLRYAIRGLRRASGFATIAVLTLALGIGANTAMFSVVNAVLFRPLPYEGANSLVVLSTDDVRRALHREPSPYPTIAAWRADNHTLQDLAYYAVYRETLNEQGVRERLRVAGVSTNLFSVLGVSPALGRGFTSGDSLGERVVVISDPFWHRRFNGDSAVIGKTFHVESDGNHATAYRIAGVAAPKFYFPDKGVDFWTVASVPAKDVLAPFERDARRWTAVARVKRGTSTADVQRDLALVSKRLAAAYKTVPSDFPGFAPAVQALRDSLTGEGIQLALWLLLAAVTLVLAIACANVASLTLARGAKREREFAVRLALGATRQRLAAQLTVESLLLAAIGGALGLALASFLGDLLRIVATSALPRIEDLTIDARVFAFVAGVSVLSGVIVGLAPVFGASRSKAGVVLRDRGSISGTRGALRFRGVLVIAQCALAVVLLTGAGLFLRSLNRLRGVEPGFDAQGVVDVRIGFASTTSAPSAAEQAVRAIGSLGDVEALGFIDDILVGSVRSRSISIPGRDPSTAQVNDARVTAGFFRTMRVPLLRGRYLTTADASAEGHAPARAMVTGERVVVNAAFARRFFPDEDAVGREFASGSAEQRQRFEIVGVVGDMRRQGREHSPIPEYYTTYVPVPGGRADLLVRVRQDADPIRLGPTIASSVRALIPGSLVWYVRTVSDQLDDFDSARYLETWLFAGFAALALVLAVVGIYGVVQYAVTQRTREIGLRMALGADSASVMWTTAKEGLRLPLIGMGIGLFVAGLLMPFMSHLLFETTVADPVTYFGVMLVLALAAAAACFPAVRRASRVDPMIALRQE